MKADRRFRRFASGLLIGLVAACGPGEPSPPPDTTARGPGIVGKLVGETGDALPYANVMACTPQVCYYADTDSEGRFTFLLDAPGDFLIKTDEMLSGEPRRSSPMVPVTVVRDETVDLGNVYAPTLPPNVPVGSDGVVEAGGGLTLFFDASTDDVPAAVAARRIPDSMVPELPVEPGERILAAYALHPFAWKSDSPIGLQVASDADTTVTFRTIDEVDGSLSDPVLGHPIGGALVTGADAGITTLTHLIVVGRD